MLMESVLPAGTQVNVQTTGHTTIIRISEITLPVGSEVRVETGHLTKIYISIPTTVLESNSATLESISTPQPAAYTRPRETQPTQQMQELEISTDRLWALHLIIISDLWESSTSTGNL